MNSPLRLWVTGVIAAAVLASSGCTGLSGAASMQVEVDAYTGPLTQSKQAQIAHAIALIDGAGLSFRLLMKDLTGDYPAVNEDLYVFCRKAESGEAGRIDTELVDLCYDVGRVTARLIVARELILEVLPGNDRNLIKQADAARRNSEEVAFGDGPTAQQRIDQGLTKPSPEVRASALDQVRKLTAGTAQQEPASAGIAADDEQSWLIILQLHGFLQDRADAWTKRSIAHTTAPTENVRRKWAQFASLSGHYGQLIGSRMDVLLKQLNVECNTRNDWQSVKACLFGSTETHPLHWWNPAARRLATLEFLRDSTADEHMEQFRWLKLESIGESDLNMDETVRAARILFENNYWTNVNRVTASGRGEVRMALVKDDIGNWNLKSFDNNPEKLLEAYRDATVAGLTALAKVAKKGVLPADGLLGFAASLSQGRLGEQEASDHAESGVADIRKDLLQSLTAVEAELAAAAALIKIDEDKAKATVLESETAVAAQKQTIDAGVALVAALDVRIDEAARAGATKARLEELATERASAQASLAAVQTERANREVKLVEAKAVLAQCTARRAATGQPAVEKAQVEL